MGSKKYQFLLNEPYHQSPPTTLHNKAVFEGFTDHTTAHGISHINTARGILKVGVLSTFIPAATTLQPSLSQNRSLVKSAPVPLPTLHSQEENRRQAADLYEQLERDSVLGANSTGPVKKTFWSIVTLLSVAGLIFYGETLFEKFFTYPVNVVVKVEHVTQLTFPAVTVCNLNPVLMQKVTSDQFLRSLLGLQTAMETNFTVNGTWSNQNGTQFNGTNLNGTLGTQFNGTNLTGTRFNIDDEATTADPPPVVPAIRRKRQTDRRPTNNRGKTLNVNAGLSLKFRQYIAELEHAEKMAYGHQREDFILECDYAGYECEISELYQFYNTKYGNCYVFNSGWNTTNVNSTDLEVSRRPGPEYGLSLTFNIDQEEYVGTFAPAAGIRVVVHSQDGMPFPEDDGFTAQPGVQTLVGLRKEDISRLSSPYGNCTDITANSETYLQNVYEEIYPVSYTTQACLKTCIQKNTMMECGCGESSFPLTGSAFNTVVNTSALTICDLTDADESDCVDSVMTKYKAGTLNCNCATSCQESVYTPTISTAYWPSDAYKEELFANLVDISDKVKRVLKDPDDPDKYQSNLAKITVYFEEFNLQSVTEIPAYQPGQFVSDIGGILGLFIGFSVLTILEFLELLIDLLVLFCYKRCASKLVRHRSLPNGSGGGSIGGRSNTTISLHGVREDSHSPPPYSSRAASMLGHHDDHHHHEPHIYHSKDSHTHSAQPQLNIVDL